MNGIPSRAMIEETRRRYPAGTKIVLEHMEGEDPKRMAAGLKGIVEGVDDAGQIHVKWENGSSLAVIPGVDTFQKMPERESFDRDER